MSFLQFTMKPGVVVTSQYIRRLVKSARYFIVQYGVWKGPFASLKVTSLLTTFQTARSTSSFVHFRPWHFLLYVRTIWYVWTKECHMVIRNNLSVASQENILVNRTE